MYIIRFNRIFQAVYASLALSSVCMVLPVYAFDAPKVSKVVSSIEDALQARIGVSILDTETGQSWHYRGQERFPLNSTHKAFACAALLAKADRGLIDLEKPVSIRPEMLVDHSPITEKNLAPKTMTLREVCSASMMYSDNTAANVVIDAIDGPSGMTRFMRWIKDPVTRLDRQETALNEAIPGDDRDTTTPDAALESLKKIVLGTVLSASSRQQMRQWLINDSVTLTSVLRLRTLVLFANTQNPTCKFTCILNQ